MKQSVRWQSKGEGNKTYKTSLGITDFDIPLFTFKGSCFIFIVLTVIMGVVPACNANLFEDPRIMNMILCSILSGLTISFTQYFINSKQKICKGFWITFICFTVMTIIILFLIYYSGKLI